MNASVRHRRDLVRGVRDQLTPRMTQREVAAVLGCSYQRIQEEEVNALYKLITRLKEMLREDL